MNQNDPQAPPSPQSGAVRQMYARWSEGLAYGHLAKLTGARSLLIDLSPTSPISAQPGVSVP